MATKRTNTKTKADRFTSDDPMHITNKDWARLYGGNPAPGRGKVARGKSDARAATERAIGKIGNAALAEHGRQIAARNAAYEAMPHKERLAPKKAAEKKQATSKKGKK